MHPREKPAQTIMEEINMQKQFKREEKDLRTNRQNTAVMNLHHVINSNPDAAELMSMQIKDGKYPDPFMNKDLHTPNRTFNQHSPM